MYKITGRFSNAKKCPLFIVVLAVALCMAAAGQDSATPSSTGPEGAVTSALREGEVALDIVTNRFITTYRNNTWVPVDLIVNNNKFDISGHIDVTIRGFTGEIQSPVYRVPVESPKNSRKQFRVYCWLKESDTLEAMLYHRDRPVTRMPMTIRLRPVNPDAVRAIILDDEPGNYGFVFTALHSEVEGAGFYHDDFPQSDLGAFPSHLACLKSYDLIVMGKMDPENFALQYRELIRQYVYEGGTLVILTGEHATPYRGSWVEELAGVEIGEVQTLDEQVLAAAFPSDLQEGARPARNSVCSRLTPRSEEVRVRGREPVLATMRSLGHGRIVVVAVDAAGGALQQCRGYQQLWFSLCHHQMPGQPLQFENLSQYLEMSIPAAVGIRIAPRESVMAYLGLYLLLAVGANWAFWSYMKRREMAWVCLIGFSLAFTLYAIYYGAAGRAKKSELAQVQILELAPDGVTGRLHACASLLSPRTTRFKMKLRDPKGLVTEAFRAESRAVRQQSILQVTQRPFVFLEDSAPAISDLIVRASEVRALQVAATVSLDGAIEGAVEARADGLSGTLRNNTGLKLSEAFLLFRGKQIPLQPEADGWKVDISNRQLHQFDSIDPRQENSFYYSNMYYFNQGQLGAAELRRGTIAFLFGQPGGAIVTNEDNTPLFCAWKASGGFDVFDGDQFEKARVDDMLLIARVPVTFEDYAPMQTVQVPCSIDKNAIVLDGGLDPWELPLHTVMGGNDAAVTLQIPWRLMKGPTGPLTIDLFWQSQYSDQRIELRPERADPGWAAAQSVNTTVVQLGYQQMNRARYVVEDWQGLVDRKDNTIPCKVYITDTPAPVPEASQAEGRQRQRQLQQQAAQAASRARARGLTRTGATGSLNRPQPLTGSFTLQAYVEKPVEAEEGDWQAWQ